MIENKTDIFAGIFSVALSLLVVLIVPNLSIKLITIFFILVILLGFLTNDNRFLQGEIIRPKKLEKWKSMKNTYRVIAVGDESYILEGILSKKNVEISFLEGNQYKKLKNTSFLKHIEASRSPLNEFMVKTEKEKV